MTRQVDPDLLERRLADATEAAVAGLGLPTPTESDLPLVDAAGGLAYQQLGTAGLAADAVTPAKIQQGTAGQLLISNTTPDTAWVTMSGDATLSGAGALTVANNAITTAKIGNDQVTPAKIQQGTAGQLLISNATPDTAWVTMSGDATLSGAGALTIGNDAVTPAKIQQGTAGQVLMTNGTPDTAWTTITGDVTVSSTGVTAIGTGVVVAADLSTTTGQPAGAWNSDTANTGFVNVTGGSIKRRWLIVGKTMVFRMRFTAGTATAASTIEWPLPGGVTSNTDEGQMVLGVNNVTIIYAAVVANSTRCRVWASNAGANFTAGQSLANVFCSGTIELA